MLTDISPGAQVDHFKILRQIGRGGMGVVYLARDMSLGRRVAIKLIHPKAITDEESRLRLLQEAQLTATFSHPNIVTVYQVGVFKSSPYVALEYVQGQPLDDRLAEEKPGQQEALRIGASIADALSEAHYHGVLHRDLKPANIIIAKDGRLRVLDFGLAKQIAGASLSQTLAGDTDTLAALNEPGEPPIETVSKGIYGTPAYMAPEQWRQEAAVPATDTWALGVILYEMLSGANPLIADCPKLGAVCMKVTEPQPLASLAVTRPDLDKEIVDLIDKCLAKDKSQRPKSDEIKHKLNDLLEKKQKFTFGIKNENPFRGLLPFNERHAGLFFGRDGEIEAFSERLRQEPILAVVGPSGAGKSSFVQAGIIPRLREQGNWTVLRMRPGGNPMQNLASRLLWGESLHHDSWSKPKISQRQKEVVGQKNKPTGPNHSPRKKIREDTIEQTLPQSDILCDTAPQTDALITADPESKNNLKTGLKTSINTAEVLKKERLLAAELSENPGKLALYLSEKAETDSAHVLLFIDQLEELYTLVDDKEVRQRFMETISIAADDAQLPVRVIVTLRDDFLGRLAEGPAARRVFSCITALRAPGTSMLLDTIVKPVQSAGYAFDDSNLPGEMVASVKGEPAALPLIQFTGHLLWQQRDREKKLLTRKTYEELGGIEGALAGHADSIIEGMSPSQELIARRLYLRLVTPERTRRVLTREELLENLGSEAETVLNRLIQERTVIVRKGRKSSELELVHESLIANWRRLRNWLDENKEEHAFLTEITQAALLWNKRNRPAQEVWVGEALQEAQSKAKKCAELPALAREFLSAGNNREKRRLIWRRRLWIGGVSLLGIALLIAVQIIVLISRKEKQTHKAKKQADVQRNKALHQKNRAENEHAEALMEGARSALLAEDLLGARARLRASMEKKDSETARALWWQLLRHPLKWKKSLGGIIHELAVSPDGNRVAAACQNGLVYIVDLISGQTQMLRGHKDQVFSVAWSKSGKIASGTWSGELLIWDLEKGTFRRLPDLETGMLSHLAFNDKSTLLLAYYRQTNALKLWDLNTEKVVYEADTLKNHAFIADMDSTGDIIGFIGKDKKLYIRSNKTGKTEKIETKMSGFSFVSVSRDGRLLAVGLAKGKVLIFDIRTRSPIVTLEGHNKTVINAKFSSDGKTLATTGGDKTIRLWNLNDGTETGVYKYPEKNAWGIDFGDTNRVLITGSHDGFLRVHDLKNFSNKEGRSKSAKDSIWSVDISPDSTKILYATQKNEMALMDLESGDFLTKKQVHNNAVISSVFSPNGELIASGSWDATIGIWDGVTGDQKYKLHGHKGQVWQVAFHPIQNLLASASTDQTVRLWDLTSRQTIRILKGHENIVSGCAFSKNGELLATSSWDKTTRIWNVASGDTKLVLRGHEGAVWGAAFSPDDKYIVTSSQDKTMRLWDVKTGKGRILGTAQGRLHWPVFHPNGRLAGSGGSDGLSYIWDIEEGTKILLRGHREDVNAITFTKDGTKAVTAGDDGTIRLWEIPSGRPTWRAPILRSLSPELLTHRGWLLLESPEIYADSKKPPLKMAVLNEKDKKWQTAIQNTSVRASESLTGGIICSVTHDDVLEIRVTKQGPPKKSYIVTTQQISGINDLMALEQGCLSLAEKTVRYHDTKGATRTIKDKVTAMALDKDGFVLVSDNRIFVYDELGKELSSLPALSSITAIKRVGKHFAVGFSEGNLQLIPADTKTQTSDFQFEEIPTSTVTKIIPGPKNTIVVGYANGFYGIWRLNQGKRLAGGQLFGAVVHLAIRNQKLYVASELGRYKVWDLSLFYKDHCTVLRDLWAKTPITWVDGKLFVKDPPSDHPCLK